MTRFQLLMQLAQTLIDEANLIHERHGSPLRLADLNQMSEPAFNAEIGFVKAICRKLAEADIPMQALMDAGGAIHEARELKPGEFGLGDLFIASFRGYMKSLAEAEITRDDWPLLPPQMVSDLISRNYPEGA